MIVILCYHKVGLPVEKPEDRRLNVSVEAFARQARFFHRRKWRSLTFPQLAEQGIRSQRNTVVFTFDDAYECAVENAAPVLKAADFTGTFFAVPERVGDASRWDGERALPLADWTALENLKKAGFAIENHTMTHPHLSKLPFEVAEMEILNAEEAIETHLRHRTNTFCYPYGDYNAQVCDALQKRSYLAACTVKSGIVRPDSSLLELPRMKIAYRDGLGGLLYKLYIRPRLK